MTFLEEIQHIWLSLMELMEYEMHFPSPIGTQTALDITMYWAVAFMLADAVSVVASRRD